VSTGTQPGSSRWRKAAFIDRDGVINEERAFVHKIEDFVFIPGAVEGLRQLQDAGYLLVIITNQSGIARGLYTEDDYLRLTEYMRQELDTRRVRLDAVEYCPHLPDAAVARYRLDCDCRKPRAGMITRASRALAIDLAASLLVGDRVSDIAAGQTAGVGRCFLVRSGYPLTGLASRLVHGVYDDLAACVRDVMSQGPSLDLASRSQ
jgi:D-glycero-D-manno-heptose 1,7-bisphosphate phosphatase